MHFTRSALIRILATAVLWELGCSAGAVATDMAPQGTHDMGTAVVAGTPQLDTVTPPIGFTVGGVAMKLTGQEFQPGALVTFDGVPATQVNVTSSTQLFAMLPERLGAFGLVPVVVQNPNGLATTRGDLFSYYATQLNFGKSTDYGPLTGSGTRGVALGDLNGDQRVDVVTATGSSDSIAIMFGDGMGGFAAPRILPTLRNVVGVSVVDVNGDNKLDVIALCAFDDKLSVFLGNGAGDFAARKDVIAASSGNKMDTGDFNGDKKVDVVLLTNNGFNIQLGDGLGGFAAPVSYGANADSVAIGDWNGDKSPDLAFASQSVKYITVFLNNGKGAFTEGQTIYGFAAANALTVIDYDSNGKLDLAVEYKDTASLLHGDGTGRFDYGPTLGSRDNSPTAIAVADFDGDQQLDIALVLPTYNIQFLSGDGKGTFAPLANIGGGGSADTLIAADFNKDKKPDLLIASRSYRGFGLMLNQSR